MHRYRSDLHTLFRKEPDNQRIARIDYIKARNQRLKMRDPNRIAVDILNGNNVAPSSQIPFAQCRINHLHSLSSGEGIFHAVALLGAAYHYYNLLHLLGYLFQDCLMSKMVGLEAPNVESTHESNSFPVRSLCLV
ncbi:Uncharacterised protein [uncultured archaeon]|nr:Uncharacterised protein [uncultured archaeon]